MTKKKLSEKFAKALKVYADDPSKRCVRKHFSLGIVCRYSGASVEHDSPGCLIGQFLTKKNAKFLDEKYHDGVAVTTVAHECPGILPAFIAENKHLAYDFQSLHDNRDYWDEQGLTMNGKIRLENIIAHNELDPEPFKEFLP